MKAVQLTLPETIFFLRELRMFTVKINLFKNVFRNGVFIALTLFSWLKKWNSLILLFRITRLIILPFERTSAAVIGTTGRLPAGGGESKIFFPDSNSGPLHRLRPSLSTPPPPRAVVISNILVDGECLLTLWKFRVTIIILKKKLFVYKVEFR